MRTNPTSKAKPAAQLQTPNEKVIHAISDGVRRGYIQYSTAGNPFDLAVTRTMAEKLGELGVLIEPLPESVSGKADGVTKEFSLKIVWEDPEHNGKLSEYEKLHPKHGLMHHFDNNMDSLMQAIHGIRVAAPSSQVSQPYRVGAIAHDALAIS